MGRLIVSAQMTLDGVIDHIDEWFDGARRRCARSTPG
jgi:hypothetical protein